ncbi:MAG: sulfurtransferase, partial [Saprospiraceae bacterium]|nr:sulfurtransferase [Saprospiraceae bacterium]
FWWMLSALGHPQVQVLDGGYQAAIEAGFPLCAGAEADAGAAPYPAKAWQWPTVGIETVERAVQDPGVLVIDVRDADRYAGKVEPIDLVAGHIPGAVNVPFSENLDAAGFFHSPAELRAKYTALLKDLEPRQVVVHCGSGVTACHTLLAFVQAGLEVPKLYVGSWSEWSRTNRPIGTNL